MIVQVADRAWFISVVSEENGGVVSHGGVDVVVVQAGVVVSTGPTPTTGPSGERAPTPSAARERPPNRAPHPLFVATV